MTHLMCWGAAAGVAVAVEVSRGFARFSLSDRCSKESSKSMMSACGWDVCSHSLSAGVGNGRAGDCLKVCRCCRGHTCNSLGVRGTCHRRRERSHRLRLVGRKRRAARGARLGSNFEMKTARPTCGIVTSRLSWTPRVLPTHAARSRDLAEGRRIRSVARRARCVGGRQRGELGERPDSDESWRPARRKRPRDSKAASTSRDLGDMAEVAQNENVFGHGSKCNTCALSWSFTVVYWLGPPGRTCRVTTKYSLTEGFNVLIPSFVA